MIYPVKTIVTHLNPDLDALCSVWLLKRFLAGWEEAEVKFVPAGVAPLQGDKDTLYVDTGFGKFDHHQTGKRTCAAQLVWKFIKKNLKPDTYDLKAIERLVDVVLRIDFDAQDITIANASDDFYSFLFNERQIIRGLRTLYRGQSEKQLEVGMTILDAILEVLKAKIKAEEIIKNSRQFETQWGKGIGADTNNEMYMHLAQENGFKVVVSKDPKKGHVRIHALPNRRIDFTDAYNKLKELDPKATWFLHASKSLLLNGSSANPDMKPTKLTLEEVIEVLKKE